jgi:DNA invertase Pin-like site-specific DNA recombinase
MQKQKSIEDQIRCCREFAASRNWPILEDHIYYDEAISGTSIAPRTQFRRLLNLASSGEAPFQYILVDDTSRVARDIIDALEVFEELTFHGIFAFYVSQGIDTRTESAPEIIAIHGITDSLYVRELAKKTHRGIDGQVLRGFSGGSKRYGYTSEPVYTGKSDIHGQPGIEGYKLKINPDEAAILNCVYYLYGVKLYSPKKIVELLNEALKELGEPKPPRGVFWSVSTLLGNKSRQSGILNNPIYVGKYIWNRTYYKRNPKTGAKKVIVNPREKWRILMMPELRIIPDDLWFKVKERQSEIKGKSSGRYTKAKRLYSAALLTSLAKCGHCDGTFGIVSGGKNFKYGCITNWNKCACQNSAKIPGSILEEEIILSITNNIYNEESLSRLTEEVRNSISELVVTELFNENREKVQKELETVTGKINNICSAVEDGIFADSLQANLRNFENRKKELENILEASKVPKGGFDISSLLLEEDLRNYFKGVVKRLENPNTTKETLNSIVDKITISSSSDMFLGIAIHEKTDATCSFIANLIGDRMGRIRLQPCPRFVSYTTRIFQAKILLSPKNLDILKKEPGEEIVLVR